MSTDKTGLPKTAQAPLAVRMRPHSLEEVVGQEHLLVPGSPLRRLIAHDEHDYEQGAGAASVILWGPPGTGKTTLAYLVAQVSGRRFVELSAVSAGVKDIRAVVEQARRSLALNGTQTVLFVDEVHRFSRSQQDALLPSVENRWVTLIAATTLNPSFSVVSPLLSRSLLLTLHPLPPAAIRTLLERALVDERGLGGVFKLDSDAKEQIVRLAGADARKALTLLEAAAGVASAAAETVAGQPAVRITVADVENAADIAAARYDRDGDQHYDVISAFIKSMRGSDPDATLHYLARMIAAGEDPRFIARRIAIAAAEDVGMADPTILQIAVAAQQAVALIGMPEAKLVLAQAAVAVATAPKSNAVTRGINAALKDIESGKGAVVPAHLRDAHYAGASALGHGKNYRYPHDYPHSIVAQTYLPTDLVGSEYYQPTNNGFERQISTRLKFIKQILEQE